MKPTMPVTDDQVAALLSDDVDLHRELYAGLDRAEAKRARLRRG